MKIASSDEEILGCFDVLNELRPDLERSTFLNTIRIMQNQGYILSFLIDGAEVVSVAGFRVYFDLSVNGPALYVYDLVTAEKHRSKGYGEKLLMSLKNHANEKGCKCIHLDSNTSRHGAHKFYLRNGFNIGAFHFLETF